MLDLYSRRIVAWSMQATMTAQLVTDALVTAVWRRGGALAATLLHHSDQGSQYSSETFQRQLAGLGITCSMSRLGNVWNNAVMESFLSTLKIERCRRRRYPSRDEARADSFDYVERFYNPIRQHSTPRQPESRRFRTRRCVGGRRGSSVTHCLGNPEPLMAHATVSRPRTEC